MQANNSNNSSGLGQGHSFQNYMSKIWLIAVGVAFIGSFLMPILFLQWFYGKDFWSEYSLFKVMIKNGQWKYFNYLNIDHSAVMLGFYFLIENIILLEIIFMYTAFKIVKAEEKRHINIEAKYREKINNETKDKDFEKKTENDKENKNKTSKFNLE
ncbi:MAG: hypothetical protein ACYCT7_01530 [bacterium]